MGVLEQVRARAEASRRKLRQTFYQTEIQLPDNTIVRHKWGAWPRQVQFLRARARYVLFGGARGGGKTVSLAEYAIAIMLAWPGIPVLVCRKDLKDLKKPGNFLSVFLERCPRELYSPQYGGQYNKSESWFRFPNGSFLQLGELKDWESYKSGTFGYILIEEANEIDEEAFLNLDPTLRWTTGKGTCDLPECKKLGPPFDGPHYRHPLYQIRMTSNPSPGWVKRRFFDPWKAGKELPDHRFILSTAFDNPSLPPNYVLALAQNNSETWVQNYLFGDWSAFENMVYPMFDPATHVWKGPIPYDRIKRVYGGIDYGATSGVAHRTAATLTAILSDGKRLTFWEYSKSGPAAEDFFEEIARLTKEFRVQAWYADSSQNRANELLRNQVDDEVDAWRYCCMLIDQREAVAAGTIEPIQFRVKRDLKGPIGTTAIRMLREAKRERLREYIKAIEG